MKPILAWVGGKKRMLSHILPHIPSNNLFYHEPFVGGGALFFHMAQQMESSSINDTDKYLIRFYRALRSYVEEIIVRLQELSQHTDKESYLRLRNEEFANDIDFAAKYIYFNRLSFSSVMRFNKQEKFNVPYRKDVKKLFDADHLRQAAKLLGYTCIYNLPFDEYFHSVVATYHGDLDGHLFYLDPPYLGTKADYALEFTDADMQLLSRWSDTIRLLGGHVIISNNAEGAAYFNEDYCRIRHNILYSVNPKRVKGLKKGEVILIGEPL